MTIKTKRNILAAGLLAIAATLAAPGALADASYPNKVIRVIVPSAAGGNLDTSTRALMREVSVVLGQPIIIENKPGASLTLGTQYVAKSPPDGYTLLAMSNTFTVAPSVVVGAGYDPIKDFDPITIMNASPLVIVVRPQSPFTSLSDLVTQARSKPDEVSYGSAGKGSTSHLVPLMFFRGAGAPNAVHVPYKGNAPLLNDLAGGQLSFAVVVYSAAIDGMADQGWLKVIGQLPATRSRLLKNVPTVGEGKELPDFHYTTWAGFMLRKNTPEPIAKRLNLALGMVLQDPEVRSQLAAQTLEAATPMSLDEAARFFEAETATYRGTAKAIGLEVQ